MNQTKPPIVLLSLESAGLSYRWNQQGFRSRQRSEDGTTVQHVTWAKSSTPCLQIGLTCFGPKGRLPGKVWSMGCSGQQKYGQNTLLMPPYFFCVLFDFLRILFGQHNPSCLGLVLLRWQVAQVGSSLRTMGGKNAEAISFLHSSSDQ